MKKKYILSLISVGLMIPSLVAAAGEKTFQQIVADLIITGSNYVLTLLVALTVLVFLYGLMKYMFKGQGSDTARSEGRKLMLWGLIGLFVMTSVWSLVGLLSNAIGHTRTGIPQFAVKTESEQAPYGRTSNGTPITREQYNNGQQLKTRIDSAVDTVSELGGRFKNNAGALRDWLSSRFKKTQ